MFILKCVLMIVLCKLMYGWMKWICSCITQCFERYTAPAISVPLPPLEFSNVEPSATPLNPRAAPCGFIQCYDKGTNKPLGIVKVHTPEEVRTAVERARVAQEVWSLTPFSTRRRLLFALMDYILANQRVICQTACIECGKIMVDGSLGELLTTFEKLRWTAAEGEDVLRSESRNVSLLTIHKVATVNYVPYGVIGAIVSWNYPFHNIFGPMISALFAGNGFVGKVSEYSSFYAQYYESIVRDGLSRLGYSPDLVKFVTGFAETGEALVSSVNKLTFIGSPGIGKVIMQTASATLTPVVLELGGKDAAVICDDANLNEILPIIMRGNFQNCGQNCVGLERIIVQATIYDQVVCELTKLVKKLTQGPASVEERDLGAMTMGKVAIDKINKLIEDSVAAGATLICGGRSGNMHSSMENGMQKRNCITNGSNGIVEENSDDNKDESEISETGKSLDTNYFFPPTILANVTPDMPIAQEEVFGPVMVIMSFHHDKEAIEMVNACQYGLGSSVFSGDISRAKYIADRLKTGMVNINDFGINYLCQSLPFGGVKISGFDRFAGPEGLRGNCVVRASTKDYCYKLCRTTIPRILQYPITQKAFNFMQNLAFVVYGRLFSQIAAVIALLLITWNDAKN